MSWLHSLLMLALIDSSAAFSPSTARPISRVSPLAAREISRTGVPRASAVETSTNLLAALFGMPGYDSDPSYVQSSALDGHEGDVALIFLLVVAFPVAVSIFGTRSGE